ncbi:MAG: hypothetical protein IKP17_07520 [Oscillospiraceae bacterium]|nr:hypothetical protein [Oscillospiraceae bacterium]
MKALLKVILAGLLAAAVALGCRWVVLQSADVINGGGTAWHEDAMLQARAMFTEKPDAVQTLTALLVEEPEESLLRRADGEPVCIREGATLPVSEELKALLEPVFSGYAGGGEVLNIEVLSDAVLFYTCYDRGGCVGFLYEKELGATDYFDMLEIVENWKLFYRLEA